ncbi:hypothetical protein ABT354_01805 [Streptomyces sp. NPDC000594]|uniref:hypothetical protein n=1 Tax=Streptomyces sp. NPDC000594 TaxID=3154261 RepID=UPI0033312E28
MNPDDFSPIKEWTSGFPGAGLDHVDFLTDRTGIAEWLAFQRVFRPRFVRYRGCTLREQPGGRELVDRLLAQCGGDVRAVEGFLNRLVLADVIHCDAGEEIDRALSAVADALRASWRGALADAFPGEEFEVWAVETDDGPVVGFLSREPMAQDGPVTGTTSRDPLSHHG